MKKLLLLALVGLNASLFAQQSNEQTAENLKKHIKYLASDKLKGRGTGTPGGEKAAVYIQKQFESNGLKPVNGNWFQPFQFTEKQMAGKCRFMAGTSELAQGIEFFPVDQTAQQAAAGNLVSVGFGICAPEQKINDYADSTLVKGKIALIRLGTPEGCNPHSKLGMYEDPTIKVETARKFGAVGVVFYREVGDKCDILPEKLGTQNNQSTIPVICLTDAGYEKVKTQIGKTAALQVELIKVQGDAKNVVGFLDNNAELTVILGAHYDHLGLGEHGGSLYRGKPEIHNGADDNASGTAALIELSKLLNSSDFKKYNYLFIAFSGEEMGLLGSNYFAKNPMMPLDKLAFMFNMDMVGRLTNNQLTLSGFGTSPNWETWVDTTYGGLKIKKEMHGIGPSDYTSFYLKDIPVLAFFTNAHSDYHKPTDDWDKINYPGEVLVMNLMLDVIKKANAAGQRPVFTKTKDTSVRSGARFTVSLGIIPDYAYEGVGVRADGVSDGKAAQKAGIKAGDIILKLGDSEIANLQAYMTALSGFHKGDKTKAVILRGKDKLEVDISF